MKGAIVLLDFGSQYSHLIKQSLEKDGILVAVEAGDIGYEEFVRKHRELVVKGVILSGSALSVKNKKIHVDSSWVEVGVPILGICFGHQWLAEFFGGVVSSKNGEFGKESLSLVGAGDIFAKMDSKTVWMSHNDSVIKLPKSFVELAYTSKSRNVAIRHKTKNIFGIQFHPEVSHTEGGGQLLSKFALDICGCETGNPWSPKLFIDELRKYSELNLEGEKIILGLSGGVDSMTLAASLRSVLGKRNILAVYIDSGLMPTETEQEVRDFCIKQDIDLAVQDSSEVFFDSLSGIVDPVSKGKVIGRVFIEEFEGIAKRSACTILAQGTIWSDVIESGMTKFSSVIKPHHNVGGLPEVMNLPLLEPLRELFKNQVREIASYLKLHENIVNKKVFPGPGFAIRVDGEVTREKVKTVRDATRVIVEVIEESTIKDKIWMGFAILIEVDSLGVKGDERVNNKHAIIVRIVESVNSMTVNYSRNAYNLLEKISYRLVHELGVGRVVYDITDKPPATIEWQ